MNETEFTLLVDEFMLMIEDAVIDAGLDIDCESSGGVLTLTCENDGSKIIISRQPALAELWVAARSGGYHCAYRDEDKEWRCGTTDETFKALLERVCSEQLGQPVTLNL